MKQLITTLAIAIAATAFGQKGDEYIIANRFVGFKDSCAVNSKVQWAPTIDDGNHKIYMYEEKMVIEYTKENVGTFITGEGIDNWKNEKEQKFVYFATVDDIKCMVTLYLNIEKKFFHVYIEYRDWVFGYNLTLDNKKKRKKK